MKEINNEGVLHWSVLFSMGIATLLLMIQAYGNVEQVGLYSEVINTTSYSQVNSITLLMMILMLISILRLIRLNRFMGERFNLYENKLSTIQSGINNLIDLKCELWQLTRTEKEVASLIIKGQSIKNISEIRGVAQTTVYRQMSNIYNKSNVNSIHEFVGIFTSEIFVITEGS
jgi:DNA-binding CsgD family transcriptional regulator